MPTLTVLHTQNLQAQFEQMTRLGTLIQQVRTAAHAEKRQVLLLDAGGSSSKDVWQSEVTRGRANYLLLEALGYDAAVLAEADWQWGKHDLQRLVEAVHFPVLGANLKETQTDTAPEGVRGYVIFRMEGISVGVVGLTQAGDADSELKTVEAKTVLETALAELKKEGAQLLIALSHLGADANRQLASEVNGIDLLIAGQAGAGQIERAGPTLVVSAGDRGTALGRVEVTYDEAGIVGALTASLIPCPPTTPIDPTAAGMLELIEFEAGVARKKAK
jgi:2',3'-cyclic-nucleotide 2'-phosphodiesterase (5'-nucleotidase family)